MELSQFRCQATRALSELHSSATFMTVHHYVNNFGEVSDFSIVFHIDYLKAVAKSLNILNAFVLSDIDVIGKPYILSELMVARLELLESFKMTLRGHNPLAVSAKAYSRVDNGQQQPINGIKLHDKQDILHLNGFRVHKNILQQGQYPLDKRAAKTIAKDDLRQRLPVGRYLQFKLTAGKFQKLVVKKISIQQEDVIKNSLNQMN